MKLATIFLCALWGFAPAGFTQTYQITERLTVDSVPSWFPVGFSLLTHGRRQYVAYYDAEHRMVVAARELDSEAWQKVVLPSKVGWDSHNYVTLAVDDRGDIHLSGNMHCVPLIYFRTKKAGDINSFERMEMTGIDEKRCTYPRFLTGANGELLFTYRSGSSGNGSNIYNKYDAETQRWSRFLDTPLFDGEGERNAYPHGPEVGPDGLFHVVWVWRDTPDCATNNHLSYARSRDMKHWETAAGKPVKLPLTLEQKELCVDPIPSHGGIINGCERLAFDRQNRPMISYHKADEAGHMQIYVTRFEDGVWQSRAVTNWDREVAFSGGGAMPFIGIRISELQRMEPDMWTLTYRHRDFGSGRLVLHEENLEPVQGGALVPRETPAELHRARIKFDGIRVKMSVDRGGSDQPGVKYMLRWEALPANHDRPRKPPLPPASTLEVVKLEVPDHLKGRWTTEQARAWHAEQPWLLGCNFIPSNAVNQLEMWQEDTFDPETINRELGWASELGMNVVRVYLHDLAYAQDPEGFLRRVDRFLDIADSHGIGVLLVIFDDCWLADPKIGKQPSPWPGVHNSAWLESPGLAQLKRYPTDPALRHRLQQYVEAVITRFRADPRVLMWDLYNEPGGWWYQRGEEPGKYTKGLTGALCVPLLKDVWGWARSIAPTQPLTSCWNRGDFEVEAALEWADIVTFHHYGNVDSLERLILMLQKGAPGRPMLCTEYLVRSRGDTFQLTLPALRKHDIGAINWGLVTGKTNTAYGWSSWDTPGKPQPKTWHHDILHADGTPLDEEEATFLRSLTQEKKER